MTTTPLRLTTDSRRAVRLAATVLAVITIAIYAQSLNFDFIHLDAGTDIPGNPHVANGLTSSNVAWAMGTRGPDTWMPLTWLSHQAVASAFGVESAAAHHGLSVLLHTVNVLLLYSLLYRMGLLLWPAVAASLLFAIHPLHIQSVAWIAQRSDVLGGCLWFAALHAYLSFTTRRTALRYLGVLIATALAMMASPLAIALPVTMLLLDIWPLRRLRGRKIRTCLVEKLPLIVMGFMAAWLTILCHHHTAGHMALADAAAVKGMGCSLVTYTSCLDKLIRPIGIAPFMPCHAVVGPATAILAMALLTLITLAMLSVVSRRPGYLVGWLWFLAALFPVHVLAQGHALPVDGRFAYLPAVGIYVMIALLVQQLSVRSDMARRVLVVAICMVLPSLALYSAGQISAWVNGERLFRHAVSVAPNNYLAWNSLGLALKHRGEDQRAEHAFERAIEMHPRFAAPHSNLGVLLAEQRRWPAAFRSLRTAVAIQPRYARAHYNLGLAYLRVGEYRSAEQSLRVGVSLSPDYAPLHFNLGNTLIALKQWSDATEAFRAALRINPRYVAAVVNLGYVLQQRGDLDGARAQYQHALTLQPGQPEATENLAEIEALAAP